MFWGGIGGGEEEGMGSLGLREGEEREVEEEEEL